MSDPFDPRYRLAPQRSADPRARKRARSVVEEQVRAQASSEVRPSNIAWFEDLLCEPERAGEGPRVGYFCNLIPQELIAALGARPVRLCCGNAAGVPTGEEVLSGEICPLAKSSFAGFLDEAGPASRCAALVVPASCDAKKKLAEVLADYLPTFVLNLPPEQNARRYAGAVADELKRMTEFLCRQLARRFRRRALLEQIELGRRRTAIVRSLLAARSANPAALGIRDLFVLVQASQTGVDLEEWNRQALAALREAQARPVARKRMRPRLVLTGAPMVWPNFKVLNLLEECGADVVADTLCTGAQSCFDPVVVDERSAGALRRALAGRYVFGSTCPCFVSQATRISRVLELVEEHRADGVINYGLRLCPLFDVEVYRLSRIMKSRKIPFTTIRTDYSLEDTEQLRVRIEAFLETIWEGL